MNGAQPPGLAIVTGAGSPTGIGFAIAQSLGAVSAHSARATKRILSKRADGCRQDDDESRSLFAEAFAGPDFREGFAAFMERRPPKFS